MLREPWGPNRVRSLPRLARLRLKQNLERSLANWEIEETDTDPSVETIVDCSKTGNVLDRTIRQWER